MTPMEELREQAAKIAEGHGYSQGYANFAAQIAAAIRAIPLPAPVTLPQAGEVVAWEYTDPDDSGRIVRCSRADPGEFPYWTERALVYATPTETPTAAAPDDMQQLHSDIIHRCTYAERLPGKAYVMRYTDVAAFVLEDRKYHRAAAPDDGLMGRYREAETLLAEACSSGDFPHESATIIRGTEWVRKSAAVRAIKVALSTATGDEGGE